MQLNEPLTVQQLRDMLEKMPADQPVFAKNLAFEVNALFFRVTDVAHNEPMRYITLWLD